jgi:hypothetical protein
VPALVIALSLLPDNYGAAFLKYAREDTRGASRSFAGPTLERVRVMEAALPLRQLHQGLLVELQVVAVGHALAALHMGLPPSLALAASLS